MVKMGRVDVIKTCLLPQFLEKGQGGPPAVAQRDWQQPCSTRTQVPSLAQHSGLKDLALPQLWCRLQLRLRSDPWLRNSKCCRTVKKKKKKKKWEEEKKNEWMKMNRERAEIKILRKTKSKKMQTQSFTNCHSRPRFQFLPSYTALLFPHNKLAFFAF